MVTTSAGFVEREVIYHLKHYLPSQPPLKDFVHHNTLHAFQHMKFEDALVNASNIFGYKVFLSIEEYRELYKKHRIREDILEDRIIRRVGAKDADEWFYKLFNKEYDSSHRARVGTLRRKWKSAYEVSLHAEVELPLFKILNCYLDQGITMWKFPRTEEGFLASIRMLEEQSFTSLFRSKRARTIIRKKDLTIRELLDILVADEQLYERYLFDQQFSHPGWSGMVSFVEDNPSSLFDGRKISLKDLVILELIFEIDALEMHYKGKWQPLSKLIRAFPLDLFEPVSYSERHQVQLIWQEAFEWSYYDAVIAGIQKMKGKSSRKENKSFQALFCIDDREGSIRRHIETINKRCETYGTPGHFGLAIFFQPKQGKFYTKVCPVPLTPQHLIKEIGTESKIEKDIHFSKRSHDPIVGIFFSIFVGFLSAFRLFVNIFKPSWSPAAASSFKHMSKGSVLTVEYFGESENGLKIGFTIQEMADRLENVLKGIGLVEDFGHLVYIIGHGASSINNPYYAGYDCGACSGRPGSVNARVFANMANRKEVRAILKERKMVIPDTTQFIGGIHDTTRDEFEFYDTDLLTTENLSAHQENLITFEKALDINAKERARRFVSINSKQSANRIHELVRNRSVSLFEARPELNHATNALCIVGRHSMNEGLFLDRRAFSNSYEYSLDPNGELLFNILNAAVPVCGGINLEYYFSRVDNQKFGAGSKLPHNVMGLIGLANGVEGDLRPGLPVQMIEAHDPLRLLMIVEHYPEVVLKTIQRNEKTYEWFEKEWMNLVVMHPETYEAFVFNKGSFEKYEPLKHLLDTIDDMDSLLESTDENMPVYLIRK